jgi:hypothetical protein
MFEKYFVTCNVAILLKNVGYDEPCIAVYDCNKVDAEHRIDYGNHPFQPHRNSKLQPWLYAAPLYQQVFEWLESKGLYLHPYKVPLLNEQPAYYGVNIFNDEGMHLWPDVPHDKDYHKNIQKYYYYDKLIAWRHAIMAAIRLFKKHINEQRKT